MTNHLKGILMSFIGVIILSPDSVLIRLADADSWTVLFWRGIINVDWRYDIYCFSPIAQRLLMSSRRSVEGGYGSVGCMEL